MLPNNNVNSNGKLDMARLQLQLELELLGVNDSVPTSHSFKLTDVNYILCGRERQQQQQQPNLATHKNSHINC